MYSTACLTATVHCTTCYWKSLSTTSLYFNASAWKTTPLESNQSRKYNVAASTHHSPPEGVSIAAEISATIVCDVVLLSEVDKVRWKDEAKEADVQRCNQLLSIMQHTSMTASVKVTVIYTSCVSTGVQISHKLLHNLCNQYHLSFQYSPVSECLPYRNICGRLGQYNYSSN